MGIGAALAASTLILAACSSGTTEETTSAAPSTTASTDASLTIWVDENRQPAVEAAAAAFEEETGAQVELVVKNFEDIRADFIAQVPTGEGPDITVGAHDWLGALVTAGVVNTVDLGDKAAEFEQVGLDAFSYDGQLYGLPYALEAVALVQNTALVGTEAPATWDDMIAAGQASGAELPVVVNVNSPTGDGYTSYGLQTSFGAPIFVQDESGSYTSDLGFAGEEGFAFAQWLSDQATAGYYDFDVTYDINIALFSEGKAAYTIQGPWAISAFQEAGIDVAVNPIPSAGGQTAAPFVGVQGFYVSSQSENALLANEFLTTYMATEDAQQALYDADPRIPAYKSVAAKAAEDPITAGFIASANAGVPMPNIPEMGDVWEFWNAAEAKIIQGEDPTASWQAFIDQLTAKLAG